VLNTALNHAGLIPWLDPVNLIDGFGPWALLGVCAIIFAETGLLVGFLLPGDTLLVITGLLTFAGVIHINIWWVALAIGFAAFLGGECGYLIGHKLGPRVFERKESGLFSVENVQRTNGFFERFGGFAVLGTLIPTAFHYVQSSRKAKKAKALAAAAPATTETGSLVLDADAFTGHPKHDN